MQDLKIICWSPLCDHGMTPGEEDEADTGWQNKK